MEDPKSVAGGYFVVMDHVVVEVMPCGACLEEVHGFWMAKFKDGRHD